MRRLAALAILAVAVASDARAAAPARWPADVDVSLCTMTLRATDDGTAWAVQSNRPHGDLELVEAPGRARVAGARLDGDGAGRGVVPAGDSDVHLTAWIDGDGCASVRYPSPRSV